MSLLQILRSRSSNRTFLPTQQRCYIQVCGLSLATCCHQLMCVCVSIHVSNFLSNDYVNADDDGFRES